MRKPTSASAPYGEAEWRRIPKADLDPARTIEHRAAGHCEVALMAFAGTRFIRRTWYGGSLAGTVEETPHTNVATANEMWRQILTGEIE